jgi:hypothetical protein
MKRNNYYFKLFKLNFTGIIILFQQNQILL